MADERHVDKPKIKCSTNEPYIVKGVEHLRNSRGEAVPTKATIALCRCGASKNKPFCDGSHWYVKFKDEKD